MHLTIFYSPVWGTCILEPQITMRSSVPGDWEVCVGVLVPHTVVSTGGDCFKRRQVHGSHVPLVTPNLLFWTMSNMQCLNASNAAGTLFQCSWSPLYYNDNLSWISWNVCMMKGIHWMLQEVNHKLEHRTWLANPHPVYLTLLRCDTLQLSTLTCGM